jgi:hypothetical protein
VVDGLFEQMVTQQADSEKKLCKIGVILTTADPRIVSDLGKALTDHSISGSVIARVMRLAGYDISEFSVRRHRRTDCACGKYIK